MKIKPEFLQRLTDDQRDGLSCCLTGQTEGPMVPVPGSPDGVFLFVLADRLRDLEGVAYETT